MFTNYLKTIGLESLIKHVKKNQLNNFVEEAFFQIKADFINEEIKNLYVYDIPKAFCRWLL